jgi:DegV family protein with EDD domain
MSKIAVVADTTCCLPEEFIRDYDVKLVPVGLVIDRKIYLDNQITSDEFWEMFHKAKEPVTTAATAPADFEKVFSQAAEEGYDGLCCIIVSKQLSATYNNAQMGAEVTQSKYPGFKIELVDSQTSAGAEGFIVLEAAKAARAGKSLEEVVDSALQIRPRVKFITVMQTLKHLIRCGRAPKAALIGSWLGVRPYIGMVSGTGLVESLGKTRGADKSIEKLVDMVGSYIDPAKPIRAMVHFTDDRNVCDKVKQMLTDRYIVDEVFITPYTPVMASATGPVISVSFCQ